MSPEKRITKRQMKEDKLVSTTFKTTEYIKQNQSTFLIAVVAVVAVIAIVLFMRWNSSKKQTDSQAYLSRAEMELAMGQNDQYIIDMQNIAENYGGTPSARIACFNLANIFFAS